MNERLRTAMLRVGVTTENLARRVGVDVKTVERWLTLGRVPHRRHRWAAAVELKVDESYLWPEVLTRSPAREREATRSELLDIYPDRASVPREVWLRLLRDAHENVDVLVFSGTFFAQIQPRVAQMLAEAVRRSATARLCFGDPESDAVAVRDREESIGGTLAAKIRSALTYYEPLLDIDRCDLRLHSTTLYASLFRYDNEILVNPHVYGEPASANPTLHFRMLDGARTAEHYLKSFERVWAGAVPWSGRS